VSENLTGSWPGNDSQPDLGVYELNGCVQDGGISHVYQATAGTVNISRLHGRLQPLRVQFCAQMG